MEIASSIVSRHFHRLWSEMFLCINLYEIFSNSRPLTFKSAHSAFSHSMSRLSRWNLMKGEMFVCQYFERHSTFRFDIEFPLQTFLECSLLKGQVFEKTRERHFSKWHFGDHSSSWIPAANPKNVKPDNTVEIYIGPQLFILQIGRIWLSCWPY